MPIDYLWTMIKLSLCCSHLKLFRCTDDIVINQIKVQEVKDAKFLGVIINNMPKLSAPTMYININFSKGISILLKLRKLFVNKALLSLYQTFVYLYFHYCIHVCGKAYNTHLNDLIVLQDKALRILNVLPPGTNMGRFYVEVSILTIKYIYNNNIGLFI